MKIALEITEIDVNDTKQRELITKFLDLLTTINKTNYDQQKINSNSDKKVLCAKCKRDLYSYYDTDEVKKIINFCQIKYKGKIYCRDCQETLEKN